MGQQQVKIPTSNHIITMVLNKQNILQITVHACNSDHKLTLQHHQEYMYIDLPQQVQQEFQSMKVLFKNVNDSQRMCCTAANSQYKIDFRSGKVILKKPNGKSMSIKVKRVQNDSDETITMQLEEKVVSLQDRLQRQVSNKRKVEQLSSIQVPYNTHAAKTHIVPLQKHFFKLQNGLELNLSHLKADLITSIKQSALQPTIVTHLDLIGNNLTSLTLREILSLNWANLRNLYLDDNLIDRTNGLQKLDKLNELSISKNLLRLQAAQHLSKTRFNQLKFLKISFLFTRDVEECWDILWSNKGINFPKLQKLIIVHDKVLPEKINRKYEEWKNKLTEQQNKRLVICEVIDLQKISNEKISTFKKIHSLKDYPEMD